MSCGLGAVALIFLLIKHNIDKPDDSIDSNIDLNPQLDELINEETQLLNKKKKLLTILNNKEIEKTELNNKISDLNTIKDSIENEIIVNTESNKNLEEKITDQM